ncbi:MAG: hypothetical protein XD73_0850 [Anaerolinea thermophila]|uniref:DUF1232 domain-containing protein n=1 Tax=Anaerolinea thermophila TaxID=167964 RepID=A0A117LGP9_9CHLR|nr:MAG: hypothetical protein XD73_0850 [Anaerolinea thermophila]
MKDQSTRFLDKFRKDDQQSFGGIIENLRLIFRLMKDPRVNSLLKLLPVGALLYLIVPIDFLPINPLEDAVVLWLGGALFIELCPDDIVQEHRLALHRSQSGVEIADTKSSDVVDAEYKDVSSHKDQ